jgi:hypothetical protein
MRIAMHSAFVPLEVTMTRSLETRSLALLVSCSLALLLVPEVAHAESLGGERPPASATSTTSLGVYSGLGYFGVNDVNGAAFLVGARLGVKRHLAFGFDFGWGALALTDSAAVEDRWWLMPSAAFVIPAGAARIDLGVGLGVATASGYDSSSTFFAAPFAPKWAFQLVPAGRLQAVAMIPVSERVDVFMRPEAGMLFGAGTLGLSNGDANRPFRDTSWAALFLGAHYRAW